MGELICLGRAQDLGESEKGSWTPSVCGFPFGSDMYLKHTPKDTMVFIIVCPPTTLSGCVAIGNLHRVAYVKLGQSQHEWLASWPPIKPTETVSSTKLDYGLEKVALPKSETNLTCKSFPELNCCPPKPLLLGQALDMGQKK